MRQGRVERVTITLVRSRNLDEELRASLLGSGVPQLADIPTAPLMSVQLRGDRSFAITCLSELEQPVNQLEPTGWEFDVLALRPGTHVLTAVVALRLQVDGHDDVRRSVPVLERSVRVHVAPIYMTGQFVRSNWQWLVATLVALGGGIAAWEKLLR
jgi:hypothetical protein